MKRKDLLSRMGMRLPMRKQVRVIISSDVANEADDQYAIVHQLLTPMFDVRGVIAAHFESKAPGSESTMEKSYQELCKLMQAIDIDDVPALRGCTAPLKDAHDTPASEGVDFLIAEALRDDPRPLYVTAQGALTDVAAALRRCPEIGEKLTVVFIGGQPYPAGGVEFNLMQDVEAGRVLMASKAAVWQIPVHVYGTMEVTMAELALRVRPCGRVGKYLYDEMEAYNLENDDAPGLRKGENWCLGDSPVVGALLQCGWRGNFHAEIAPLIADDMRYLPNPGGKEIRVYDSVDVRFILEDMYAKLRLSCDTIP
ncbi:MAG: nucleoside hydrolase [Oscillospiraceae bacterium]|nr:nucleoside hydrolase [Oscillospiraceae bacterium]